MHSLLILLTVGPLEMQKRHNCQRHLRLTVFFSAFMKGTRDTSGTISDLGGWSRPVGGVNIDVENNVS